jgi:hypothetical protein
MEDTRRHACPATPRTPPCPCATYVKLSTAVGTSTSPRKDLRPYLGRDGPRFEGIEQSSGIPAPARQGWGVAVAAISSSWTARSPETAEAAVATGCDTRNRTRQGTARGSATRKVSAGARNAAVPSPLRPPSVATKIVFDGVPEIRDFPSDERVHRIVAIDNLFQPLTVRSLTVPNRFAMAPMTRQASPGGIPGADVAEYYRRRAAGGVGLIITEGIRLPTPAAYGGNAKAFQDP